MQNSIKIKNEDLEEIGPVSARSLFILSLIFLRLYQESCKKLQAIKTLVPEQMVVY